MQHVGLIIGKGFGKAVCGLRTARFRSLAARWEPAAFDGAYGAPPRLTQLDDSSNWLVGDEVTTFLPAQAVALTDRARYAESAFRAMTRHALAQVVLPAQAGPLWVRTGMPTAWFGDRTARQALVDAITEAATPWGVQNVDVSPESAGAFFALLLPSGRVERPVLARRYGVIDWGYRDVNVALFEQGRYVRGESVAVGISEALRTIQRLISADPALRLELSLPEVDEALRSGAVFVDGHNVPLPVGTQEALDGLLTPVLALARSLWPEGGRQLHGVILSGGSVVPFAPALWAEWPQILVPGAAELPSALDRARETVLPSISGPVTPARIRAALADGHRPTAEAIRRAVAAADPQMLPAAGFALAAAVQAQAAEFFQS